MRKLVMMFAVATVMFLMSAIGVFAAPSYSPFGDAGIVSPGNASNRAVRVESDTTSPGYGGIDFDVPAGMTLADLGTLSTDYKSISGGCGGGAPRFVVLTADGGQIEFWWNCVNDGLYHNTGDLTDGNADRGGSFGYGYQVPFSTIQALHGSSVITYIYIVMDGSWSVGDQVFDFDNTNVDGTLYTYELPTPANAAACKNGGWQTLFRANGTPFRNQGDCIQYVNTGK